MELSELGISPQKEKQFKAKGIASIEDLLAFLPRRYEDHSNVVPLNALDGYSGQTVSVMGKVKSVYADRIKQYVTAILWDDNGNEISVTWFHQLFMAQKLFRGREYLVSGKLQYTPQYRRYSIVSPTLVTDNIQMAAEPLPIYSKINGMSAEYIREHMKKAIGLAEAQGLDDGLDAGICRAAGLDSYVVFLHKAHFPKTFQEVQDAEMRKNAAALAPFCFDLAVRRHELKSATDKVVDTATAQKSLSDFRASLPFALTKGQEDAIHETAICLSSGKRLDALVQGDVGCGKTVVAIALALIVAKSGYQVAIMAPTSVLAAQHYKEITSRLSAFGCRAGLLHGGLKAKEKRLLLAQTAAGDIDILVGTHAVLGNDVVFKSLGMTVVDEEHRFGVEQRAALRQKAIRGAHNVSMSATPIPRSLALTMYGEGTRVINIHTMPAGRKAVKTIVYSDETKTYEAMYRQICAGRQCYVICPLITDSTAEGMEDVDSVETTHKKMSAFFSAHPEVHISAISGRMKAEDIQSEVSAFADGRTQILLSTTIVEVGVNIPNATVMVIKNAERFGLAQLHQLRGRVGRGTEQAYCVLLSTDTHNERLQTMARTCDGFEIARADLQQRGTGNLTGKEQSGAFKEVALMVQYPELYAAITGEVEGIIAGKERYEALSQFACHPSRRTE